MFAKVLTILFPLFLCATPSSDEINIYFTEQTSNLGFCEGLWQFEEPQFLSSALLDTEVLPQGHC